MSYRVDLDIYFGPIDLLLYLVRRDEVDVLDLPISSITTQFVEYLDVLEFLDIDMIGDFVMMASTLVEMKSRLVLPQSQEAEQETDESETTDDPRADLIQQLLEYKKYRDASKALEERAAEWQERYPRLSNDRPRKGTSASVDRIKEVELWDLVSALSRIFRRKEIKEETSIRYDDVPISVYMDRVMAQVRASGRVTFNSFFEKTSIRTEIVGIFLAILELLRKHRFRSEQETDFGEIWIIAPDSEADQESSTAQRNAVAALEKQLPRLLRDDTHGEHVA